MKYIIYIQLVDLPINRCRLPGALYGLRARKSFAVGTFESSAPDERREKETERGSNRTGTVRITHFDRTQTGVYSLRDRTYERILSRSNNNYWKNEKKKTRIAIV